MQKSIINIGDKCFGCGACVQSCPTNAITMEYDTEGFLYPKIDESKCINCGMCLMACPASDQVFAPHTEMPKCYAAFYNNDTAMQSSSGGIFSALSETILDSGGFVCGAAFDNEWMVSHKVISDKNELGEFRTSKYLQSDTKRVYSEIRTLLDSGASVLFSGTPCQVAGIYGFLGKDYDNLLTTDVFCHGVPSPKVWQEYLGEIGDTTAIESINLRDKTRATHSKFNISICWSKKSSSGNTAKKNISERYMDNIYMHGFLKNLYLRKSCATCAFAKTPRTSDISLGDFWQYDKVDKRRDTSKGISAVLLNTAKGEKFFNQIKDKLQFIKRVALENIIRGNPVLEKPCQTHKSRAGFFADFADKKTSISSLIEKHLGLPDDKAVGIMNFSSISVHNYGAVLVGYAMERVIEKTGYKPKTINFIPKQTLFSATDDNAFAKFRKKFLNLTGVCTSKKELCENINKCFNRICIGSDQIVRNKWSSDFIYYLDWVNGKKTLLSYAASFGIPDIEMEYDRLKYAKKCLERFDAFSVREYSGAEIMKNNFGMDCPTVCDPTMLLEPDDYQPIIDAEAVVKLPKEYIAYYFLHEKPEILSRLAEKYEIIDAYKDISGNYRTVGDWLNIIKNAKYLITDSFHGGAFAIIFRKQFIVLPTLYGGNERLKTLMSFLGYNRFITDGRPIDETLFDDKIDYDKAAASLSKMKNDGYAYLSKALAIKPSNKNRLIYTKDYETRYIRLFGFIPFLKLRYKRNRIYIRLFEIIPLLKIKHNKAYLFNFIRVANIKD